MDRSAAPAASGKAKGRMIPLDEHTHLHAMCEEVAEELFAVIDRNRERLQQWLPWAVPDYSIEHTREFLRAQAIETANEESLGMTIRHKGAICGAIGLHKIDWRNKNSAIGYWLDGAHEGKGIMTAACRAMLSEAFSNLGLHRIEIRCATWNHRSSAIPKRLEFVEEGILKEAEWVHDRWLDLRVYSMLAQDWKTRAA